MAPAPSFKAGKYRAPKMSRCRQAHLVKAPIPARAMHVTFMMTQMSEEEARALLRRGSVARLGCVVDGDPYVVPVIYFCEDDCAYVHSLPGQKITALRAHPRACLQVDEIEETCRWRSVLAVGEYQELFDPQDRARFLNELLRRFPMLTPIESALVRDASPLNIVVFRVKIEKISGIQET